MNQTHQVVRQDARDAPRDAAVTMAEGKPDRTLVARRILAILEGE